MRERFQMNATEIVSQEQAPVTREQAEALVPAPHWSDRPGYERVIYDNPDDGYSIYDKATIAETHTVRVGMVWETDVHADGTVRPTMESVRVAHADEEFWIETRHLGDVLDAIRTATTDMGVTL